MPSIDVQPNCAKPGPTAEDVAKFRAWTVLHQWRTWVLAIDPWLPAELLPQHWAGDVELELVRERYRRWQGAAGRWWAAHEPAK